ncbi:Drug/Metabolite Transporter (DMT) Superfamily [Phytophthora cinnamomi]|uniref:Drug/Metabolite Transporter (DMT) Superfamily n=1 Tax=Phytophthora cinnamomi TaxID=4785 RepID=UPI00355A26FB|nr:Drug/Metabolite Transporter (DMT) Superfamily [Phytophthora cinnamomi]
MEGRERLQIDTEVPSNVYALDLHKLSELAHIPEAELVRGMQSEDAVDMQGVVVNRGQEVPFEAVGKTPEDDDDSVGAALSPDAGPSPVGVAADAGVKQVLLTAASSTMCLDGSDTPKCLIMLGEYTLIEHILAQLFVAGMERVVIIISYFGHEIMEHVKESFLYSKLQIEFLNLGEETPYGHARTLLSAREMFTKPFLIHTADHIFDRAIISRMAHFELEGCVACVLVDADKEKLKGLPSTAGKVLLDSTNGMIRKIGRGLKQFDAIDAGLFLTTGRLFAALEMLAYEKPKFSLAEALNVLRPSYGLKYLETDGDAWLSVETQEQLDAIVANDSVASLSPWPVFVAKEPTEKVPARPMTPGGKNVFLAVSAADDDSMLRAVDAHVRQSADVFEGFVGLPQFSTRNMILFLTCSLSYAVFLMTFLWSLSHTSIDHAYIFNNCHSLLMVVGRLLLGRYVSQFEGLGTAIGVIGGALTTLDHQQSSSSEAEVVQVSLAGDLVALVGAVGGALYLITAKKLRTEMDISILFVGMFTLLALLIFPVFSLLDIPFEASRDPEIGLFGWLDPSRAASEAYIVLVCTLVGTLGYIAVMKYFAPIVVSVVMLVEPVLAAFMGVAVGVDVFPGLLTIVGSVLIIGGTALVIVSNSSKTQTIDATQAMSSTSTALPKGLSSATAAGLRLPQTTPSTNLRYV